MRDVALAFEESGTTGLGHEVTSPPSDADLNETARIITDAVEAGTSPHSCRATPMRSRRGAATRLRCHPRNPTSADEADDRDSEMQEP